MHGAAFFSPDYATARQRFRAEASRLGIPLAAHALAAPGPHGEALSIDVATIGAAHGRRVFILSSGLHGVEGFFGSAVQLAWLAQFAAAAQLPNDVKVVLVHALNPYGFAWLRRWNENNVDLNRNFLSDREFLNSPEYRSSLAAYDRLSAFLNPAGPPSRWEPYTLKAAGRILAAGYSARQRLSAERRPAMLALAALAQLGLAELQKTLPVGQYQYRRGLFYGGEAPEESTLWLQERLPVWQDGADLTLHLDLHTGLGRWADYKLLVVDRIDSPRAQWVAERFGDGVVEAWDGKTAYGANGTMAGYFRDRNAGGIYHGLTAEFGTYPRLRVLGALRAENQAHFYADPDSPAYRWAKRQVRAVFAPAATDWRAAVVAKALALVARALDVCGSGAPSPAAEVAAPGAAADRSGRQRR